MGDWSSTIECGRLEELATLAKSLKAPLLRVGEGNIGWLNLRVEGHEYLVTRCSRVGVRVCRMDLDDLTRARRFGQAIVEFFSHQVFDFLRLRGVGTRSRRIARVVENWTRFPDGTENTQGPPLLPRPAWTGTLSTKSVKESECDYVRDHLSNHCTQQARAISLSSESAPLNNSDRESRRRIGKIAFPLPRNAIVSAAVELDDDACDAILRQAFASVPIVPRSFAGLQLNAALQSIARRESGMSDPATGSPMVAWARLLLLGHAISTKPSAEFRPTQRSAQEGFALLEMLLTGGVFHRLEGADCTPPECWHAARRLARCELGFRLLCEFAAVPPGLAPGAEPQWHAALRIYLQTADHLIAASAPERKDGSPGARANAGDTAALAAWIGPPMEAARYAATLLSNPSHPRANRLAYRALLAAVKLMQIRVLADTAWLKRQRQMAAANGIGAVPSLDAPLDKDEIVALCLWRNGFRDDLDDGLLAQFQRMLNKLVVEYLPHEERDPATGDIKHHVPDSSPVMLALGDPMTQAATRRTLTEQSEDYQAAIGRMARLLILRMKTSAGLSTYHQTVEKELSSIPKIDRDLLDQWAREVGIIAGTDSPHLGPEGSPATRPGAARHFQRHSDIASMLRVGRDKTDAGVMLPEAPRSREHFRLFARHRFDGSLGTGSRASITRAAGVRAAVSIDTGPAQVLTPGAPSIGFSFSHEDTLARTHSFSLIGSSVGGQTLSVSETVGERSQSGAGVSVSGPAALSVGVDGSLAQSGAIERGIALRTPPTPGSRKWVRAGQQSIDVIFGPRLERKLAKDRRQAPITPTPDRALRELCLQCFDGLLSGALALNVFDNQLATETRTAGISVGISTGVLGDVLAKVSASGRLSKERDRLGPQSRVDRTGSTRLEIHSIGTASRYNAALRLLVSLLPTELSQHFKTELSTGTAFGVAATFCEGGVQHFFRREARDDLTQPSFAWDIVYRNVDEFIAHMKSREIREQWDRFNASQDKRERWALDERLQQIRLHARHSNQTYMVRRHLKRDKLGELNAMKALMDGLHGASAPFDQVVGRHGLPERCLSLLDADDNYLLGGFGTYTGDYHETQTGLNGTGIFTETRTVSVATELLWFSARPAASAPKAMEETGVSVLAGLSHKP